MNETFLKTLNLQYIDQGVNIFLPHITSEQDILEKLYNYILKECKVFYHNIFYLYNYSLYDHSKMIVSEVTRKKNVLYPLVYLIANLSILKQWPRVIVWTHLLFGQLLVLDNSQRIRQLLTLITGELLSHRLQQLIDKIKVQGILLKTSQTD